MILTDKDKHEIAVLVADLIRPYMRSCQCGISPETAKEMGHLMGRLKDVGKGNLNVGIEAAGTAVQCIIRIRHIGERVGGAVAIAVTVTAAGGLLSLLWLGFKASVAAFKNTVP